MRKIIVSVLTYFGLAVILLLLFLVVIPSRATKFISYEIGMPRVGGAMLNLHGVALGYGETPLCPRGGYFSYSNLGKNIVPILTNNAVGDDNFAQLSNTQTDSTILFSGDIINVPTQILILKMGSHNWSVLKNCPKSAN